MRKFLYFKIQITLQKIKMNEKNEKPPAWVIRCERTYVIDGSVIVLKQIASRQSPAASSQLPAA